MGGRTVYVAEATFADGTSEKLAFERAGDLLANLELYLKIWGERDSHYRLETRKEWKRDDGEEA